MKIKKMYPTVSAGLVIGALALAALAPVSAVFADTTPVTVTIENYINGAMATAQSAGSSDFQMSATWTADNIGSGSGTYALSATGTAPDTTPYEAQTVSMSSGANYSTSEIADGTVVGTVCAANSTTPGYTLAGYSTGATLAAAIAATPTTTVPTFTGLTTDQFVVVWNTSCAPAVVTPPATVDVTVAGYVNGALATAASTNNASFQMNAGWTANGSTATGSYTLGATGFNTPTAYEASTGDYNSGASYTTNEVMDGTTTGATCSATSATPAYTLAGYSTGATMAAALAATPTMTAPSFTNLTTNEFVIVWNTSCAPATTTTTTTTGTVAGTVTGGVAAGALAVTSVTAVNTSAIADGTFANGWKYIFNITVPTAESHLSMKFGNWIDSVDGATVLAANNIRISSVQADNADATVLMTAPETYSAPLNMTTDLDSTTPGTQVQVLVETAVPLNSVNGSYTTDFGVQTLP